MTLLITLLTQQTSGGGGGGSGDVNGPGSSTANGLTSFSGTGGKTIQSQSNITTGANSTLTGGTTEDVIIASQNNHSIQLNPNGNGIVKAGSTVFAQASVPSGLVSLAANNTSATGAGSLIGAVVNGLSAGNAYYTAGNGTTDIAWGQNSSDASAYVVSMSNVLGSNNAFRLGTDLSATFYGGVSGITTLSTSSSVDINSNGDAGVSIFYSGGKNIITGNFGPLLFTSDSQQVYFSFSDLFDVGDINFENNDPTNATASLTFTPGLVSLTATSTNTTISLTPTGSGTVAANSRITAVTAGTGATDAVNLGQIQANAYSPILTTVSGTVDLSAATPVTLYTVPTGKSFIVLYVVIIGGNAIVGGPQIAVGTNNPTYNNILTATPVPPTLVTGKYASLPPPPGGNIAASTEVISALPTPAGGSGTITMQLVGILS